MIALEFQIFVHTAKYIYCRINFEGGNRAIKSYQRFEGSRFSSQVCFYMQSVIKTKPGFFPVSSRAVYY